MGSADASTVRSGLTPSETGKGWETKTVHVKMVTFHTNAKANAFLICSTGTFMDLVALIIGNLHGTMRSQSLKIECRFQYVLPAWSWATRLAFLSLFPPLKNWYDEDNFNPCPSVSKIIAEEVCEGGLYKVLCEVTVLLGREWSKMLSYL